MKTSMHKLNPKDKNDRERIERDSAKMAHELELEFMNRRTTYRRICGLPLIREGVFSYLGRDIDRQGIFGLEYARYYKVYRSAQAIKKREFVQSFSGVPLLFRQTMGTGHAMKYDPERDIFFQRGGGTIGCVLNPRYDASKKAVLVDVVVWDDDIYECLKTQGCLKKLTCGYLCEYTRNSGAFGGKKYAFEQRPHHADHAHLVLKVRGDRMTDGGQIRAIPDGNMVEGIDKWRTVGNAERNVTGIRKDCATSQTPNATTALVPDASTTSTRTGSRSSKARATVTTKTSVRGNGASKCVEANSTRCTAV